MGRNQPLCLQDYRPSASGRERIVRTRLRPAQASPKPPPMGPAALGNLVWECVYSRSRQGVLRVRTIAGHPTGTECRRRDPLSWGTPPRFDCGQAFTDDKPKARDTCLGFSRTRCKAAVATRQICRGCFGPDTVASLDGQLEGVPGKRLGMEPHGGPLRLALAIPRNAEPRHF